MAYLNTEPSSTPASIAKASQCRSAGTWRPLRQPEAVALETVQAFMMAESFTLAKPARIGAKAEGSALACGSSARHRSSSDRAMAMERPRRRRTSRDCAGWASQPLGQRT